MTGDVVTESSLAVLLKDGERIAENLIPPGSSIEKVVGALILHVEQAAGSKLESLADEVLGIAPPQATAAEEESLSQLEVENAELRKQIAGEQGAAPIDPALKSAGLTLGGAPVESQKVAEARKALAAAEAESTGAGS
jgi:hypothetical protein